MTTKNTTTTELQPGTRVVSKADGEEGRIVRVATYRRNGIKVWAYLVASDYGLETWDASDLFVPERD